MSDVFETIRMEGKLFTGDHLVRIKAGDLPGITPKDYGRRGGRLEEEISRHWTQLEDSWGVFQVMLSSDESRAYEHIRDYWLERVFHVLGFGHLVEGKPKVIEGKAYPILFEEKGIPIHIVPATQDLEQGPDGTARGNPHSLLQEYLNRREDTTWGILTNGLKMRVLRDNAASKLAQYVEFNLQAMMSGQHFHEFGIFWRLMHVTRFTGDEPWIEKWMRESARQGVRAHKDLKEGVVKAIIALGRGFLRHRKNSIGERLNDGSLSKQDYYHELLRLVYRFIFLFVTEDRDLLLQPDSEANRKQRRAYMENYSTQRLRRLARRSHGSKHHDAYEQVKIIMNGLKRGEGIPELALPGLNGDLWNPGFIPTLEMSHITNEDLYVALRHLSVTKKSKQYHAIDYVHLDSEELGGIYETLLELHPVIMADGYGFDLDRAAGSDRKTSGSYYTPPELVELTLDEALDPVLTEAAAKENPEAAILNLKVCDPTVGSGHFIIGAARRIAHKLAQVRTFEEEPSPTDRRHALRDVVANCIYGVDLNKMAVELCKVALWLEAIEPGKPLTYLEHRIKHGNGFFGATPKMLAEGIPDAAYKPVVLDDPETCKQWKKKNTDVVKALSGHQRLSLFHHAQEALAKNIAAIDGLPSETVQNIAVKEEAYRDQFLRSDEYHRARMALDAICAAWTQIKPAHTQKLGESGIVKVPAITTGSVIEALDGHLSNDIEAIITSERERHRFFHWHLEFPEVFNGARGPTNRIAGWTGGFDVVVGNPPWEKVKLQEKEYFAATAPAIGKAGTKSKRAKLIAELATADSTAYNLYISALRERSCQSEFVHNSDGWPLCGHGDTNTYAVFAEQNKNLIHHAGSVGCIVQTGIAVDDTYKLFFQDLVTTSAVRAVFDFENHGMFPEVHRSQHFCLLSFTGPNSSVRGVARFGFYLDDPMAINRPDGTFTLTAKEIVAINPLSKTCPVFRNPRDGELNARIYAANPILKPSQRDDWNVELLQVFHMSNESGLFHNAAELVSDGWTQDGVKWVRSGMEMWPTWEGKMVAHYDHRFADIIYNPENASRPQQPRPTPASKKQDPLFAATPYQWAPKSEAERRVPDYWPHDWFPAIKRVSSATNERTFTGCIIPQGAISYTLYPIVSSTTHPKLLCCLLANLLSIPGDYLVRQKTTQPSLPKGVIYETAVIAPHYYLAPCPWDAQQKLADWVLARVVELSYTSHHLDGFAQDMGYAGAPFTWNPVRRLQLRAELDAAYAVLYGFSRQDLDHVLTTFPGIAKKESRLIGEFATRRLVGGVYDAMVAAAGGTAYSWPSDLELPHPIEFLETEAQAEASGHPMLADA